MQPYTLRAHLLDPAEQSLYRALTLVLCQRALLFVKIHLSDLFAAPGDSTAGVAPVQPAYYPLDFVLCDRNTLRPLAVILLEKEVAPTDEEGVDKGAELCAAAGLPVVRLQRQPTYLMPHLISMLEPLLVGSSVSDAFGNGDRAPSAISAPMAPLPPLSKPRTSHRQPAYPGYGALRTLANKLS